MLHIPVVVQGAFFSDWNLYNTGKWRLSACFYISLLAVQLTSPPFLKIFTFWAPSRSLRPRELFSIEFKYTEFGSKDGYDPLHLPSMINGYSSFNNWVDLSVKVSNLQLMLRMFFIYLFIYDFVYLNCLLVVCFFRYLGCTFWLGSRLVVAAPPHSFLS